MNLSVTRGTVTRGQDTWTGVRALVAGDVLRVVDRKGATVLTANVTSVVHPDRRTWLLDTDEGGVTVTRKGCGCGGGR